MIGVFVHESEVLEMDFLVSHPVVKVCTSTMYICSLNVTKDTQQTQQTQKLVHHGESHLSTPGEPGERGHWRTIGEDRAQSQSDVVLRGHQCLLHPTSHDSTI